MSQPKLGIIVGSTRPCRIGEPIGRWVLKVAGDYGGFETELIDLAEVNLPFLDEPDHPRLRNYTQRHTLEWSARVDELDAVVFVTPEYNHGFPAPLKNAIDFLYQEWRYKPAGIVCYGGASGGTRAAQMLKPVLSVLKMMPISEGVAIANAKSIADPDGWVTATPAMERAAGSMFTELERWVHAAAPLRSKV
ncbi:MAG TPA: NAD(P)H-dependent oxidoreductase [Actinomycetota bacterium]|nr:NAD(P)H-dependent oxidoreductase [Actinomycetota bacterium]